jgi:uncharacterized protein
MLCTSITHKRQLCVHLLRIKYNFAYKFCTQNQILMYQRAIFPELEQHLTVKQITVITGMRRVGKSTALKYLLQKVPHENKLYLDLERVENRFTFEQLTYKDVQIDLEIAGIDFSKPAVIALDEIQLVPQITSVVKWFYDTYPELKFLVTGSSSFYLKNRFTESLAGRKHVFEMFPLSFIEFLQFREVNTSVLETFRMQPFQQGIYLHFKSYYQEYVQFGGFPDVVLASNETNKIRTIKDVINSYIDLDIKLVADFEASGMLYKLVKLLAASAGSLIDVSKLASILGIDRRKLNGYLELLESTYFTHSVTPFSKNVLREISQRKKIYLADTGILQQLAQVNTGQVTESAVFLQLKKTYEQVNYYQRKSGQEIDFIVNQDTAIEVKETPAQSDLASLFGKTQSIGLTSSKLIGRNLPANDWKEFIWAGHVF